MAIQHRRGNFADFDPFKMLPGEFAYSLDTEELYYCIAPGNVKRCATKEDVMQILETNQEAYDGLQQLLVELESETVLTGILNNISTLLSDVAINKSNIATNTQGVADLDTRVSTHLAESAKKHITESGTNINGHYIKFDDGTAICSATQENINAVTTTAYGALFREEQNQSWTYPLSMVEVYSGNVRGDYSAPFTYINGMGVSGITYRGVNVSAGTSTYRAFLMVIGRWK